MLEKWIAETIASVAGQTHPDLEIIVIDDGSRDDTLARARRICSRQAIGRILWSSSKTRALRQREIAASRLPRAIGSSSWTPTIFSNPKRLRSKSHASRPQRRPRNICDVVYSDWRKLVWDSGAWTEHDVRHPVIGPDALADILSDRDFLQLGCMLMKKASITAAGGFDTSHEPIEDVGLCVKIAIQGGVYVKAPSNGPVASYRDLPRSLSKLSQKKFIEFLH